MNPMPVPPNNTRVGFHYFPDSIHFRDMDIVTWLPEIKKFNASWLILDAPLTRAVSESFIQTLIANNIEPVLHINPSLGTIPSLPDLKLLLDSYAKWGVHYVILYDRPNLKSSWPAASWTQDDLVERFLDRFIPLANLVQQSGLIPVFPPLQPGGDYWDTAFLKSSLEAFVRRGKNDLLEKLVLSAVAEFSEKGLNWGSGGPERWPGARPYHTSEAEEDHRGFYIFEWYNAICQVALQKLLPIFLLDTGIRGEQTTRVQEYLPVFQLLNNEPANLPGSVENRLDPVTDNVLSCTFRLVPETNESSIGKAFYNTDQQPTGLQKTILRWLASRKNSEINKAEPLTNNKHPLAHYLLLPAYEWGISEWHLDVIRPFVKRHLPTVGFSITEAALAEKVTVIGGPQSFSEESMQFLCESGCQVERISGDGTSIASQLAER